jgi:hypothetical protein
VAGAGAATSPVNRRQEAGWATMQGRLEASAVRVGGSQLRSRLLSENQEWGEMSTIRELIDDVRQLDLVLPEFRREYVWSREQAKQLMVSLFRSYPTGSLLFWKTDNPPEIKNQAVEKDRIGTTTVILDGQQRLTTLYLLTRGDIPPYYTESDLETDPRSLYFDLDSGDFQYFQATRMRGNPTWVSVVDCFNDGLVNPFEVAKQTVAQDQDPFELAERYNGNLNRLRNIRERSYPIQTVPPNASIDDAIDVFDRVDSLGTKVAGLPEFPDVFDSRSRRGLSEGYLEAMVSGADEHQFRLESGGALLLSRPADYVFVLL